MVPLIISDPLQCFASREGCQDSVSILGTLLRVKGQFLSCCPLDWSQLLLNCQDDGVQGALEVKAGSMWMIIGLHCASKHLKIPIDGAA